MKNTTKAHIGLLSANLIYGGGFIIAKGLMPDIIGPSGFILLRVIAATSMFWALNIFGGGLITNRKDLGRLFLCAFFGVAANQLLFFNGLNLTSPINASIIMTSNPIVVMLLTAFVLRKKLEPYRWFGVALGALGAILLIYSKGTSNSILASTKGDLMVFLNAASYAGYLVLVKPLMQRYSPIQVISNVFLIGFVLIIPFGWDEFWEVEWSAISFNNWLAISYVLIAVSFLTYLFNIFSLKHVSATVTSSYIYLQPVFATAISYAIASYTGNTSYADLTWQKAMYTVLIFIGVYLVSKPVKTKN